MSIMNLKILGCTGKFILLHCRSKEVCDFYCFQSPIQEAQLFLRFLTLFNSSYYCFHIVYSLFVFVYFFNCLKFCDLNVFKYYSSLRIILYVSTPIVWVCLLLFYSNLSIILTFFKPSLFMLFQIFLQVCQLF